MAQPSFVKVRKTSSRKTSYTITGTLNLHCKHNATWNGAQTAITLITRQNRNNRVNLQNPTLYFRVEFSHRLRNESCKTACATVAPTMPLNRLGRAVCATGAPVVTIERPTRVRDLTAVFHFRLHVRTDNASPVAQSIVTSCAYSHRTMTTAVARAPSMRTVNRQLTAQFAHDMPYCLPS